MIDVIGDSAETRPHDAAIPVVFLASIIGGVAVGSLLWVSWRYYYIPFLSPAFAAMLAAMLLRRVIDFTRLSHLLIVTTCAVLMGLVLYGTLWVEKYVYAMSQYRAELRTVAEEENIGLELDNKTANKVINAFFEDETGQRGFIGYVLVEAKDGMTITPQRATVGSRQETNIGQPLTILYWIIEILIILRMILVMARTTSKKYRVVVPSFIEA
ncbi:MAG: hypothetical protein HY862_01395 [Chloroflexi bacterium]|nr:hypothetical protein [Chloroflexota bacterium]